MFNKFNLQNSYDKVRFLTLMQFALVIMGFVSEAIITNSFIYFGFFLQSILLLVTFNFYYKALNNLQYTYWNISLILAVYYILSIARNLFVINSHFIGLLFLTSFGLLIVCSYIISSPLYFPRVHWWEYDFRFRADLRCWADIDGKQFRGRLSDLRRGAACLELFHNVQVGQPLQINLEILDQNFTLFAEVRSKREPIIGRSMVYGIKFVHSDLEQRQRLKLLTNYWNESRKIKIRNKFSIIKK